MQIASTCEPFPTLMATNARADEEDGLVVSMAQVVQQAARKRQRRKESLLRFSIKDSKALWGLRLWKDVLSAILAEANPFRFTGNTTGNRKDQIEGES